MYSMSKSRTVGVPVERVAFCAVTFWAILAEARVPQDASVLLQISSRGVAHPPEVPHDGFHVLKPVDPHSCRPAKGSKLSQRRTSLANTSDAKVVSAEKATLGQHGQNLHRRQAFACAAGCSTSEPQLEASLAPWADWKQNSSGLEMLAALEGFCEKHATANTPFILTVLWQGDVYMKPCQRDTLADASFYLIGPEDLSLVLIFLLSAQRIATLPDGPIAFGMYLSDYTSLLDRHLVGPGLPIFAYLGRATSWLIPWPSSYTVQSTKEVEELEQQQRERLVLASEDHAPNEKASVATASRHKLWQDREAKAYWIGAVTGPWQFALDADLMAIPRLKVLKLAKEHPKQLLAEWSSMAGYGVSWVKDEKNVSGFLAPHSRSVTELTGVAKSTYKDTSSWDGFKYYINLDGVVLGGRLNKLLSLGGVVLQQQAGYVEHIDGLVKPYEHYVPIEYDLSDLVAKVEWLQNNDAEAKRIAANGRKLAMQRIRLEDHLCYVWRALEALGSKTAQVRSDDSDIALKLKSYRRITVKEDDDMRSMLESFWGDHLEKVSTGDRTMNKDGIELLEWAWKRFQDLHAKAQKYNM